MLKDVSERFKYFFVSESNLFKAWWHDLRFKNPVLLVFFSVYLAVSFDLEGFLAV